MVVGDYVREGHVMIDFEHTSAVRRAPADSFLCPSTMPAPRQWRAPSSANLSAPSGPCPQHHSALTNSTLALVGQARTLPCAKAAKRPLFRHTATLVCGETIPFLDPRRSIARPQARTFCLCKLCVSFYLSNYNRHSRHFIQMRNNSVRILSLLSLRNAWLSLGRRVRRRRRRWRVGGIRSWPFIVLSGAHVPCAPLLAQCMGRRAWNWPHTGLWRAWRGRGLGDDAPGVSWPRVRRSFAGEVCTSWYMLQFIEWRCADVIEFRGQYSMPHIPECIFRSVALCQVRLSFKVPCFPIY